jgi:hypothetical protein
MGYREMTPAVTIIKTQSPSAWGVMLQYAYLQLMDLLSTLAFLLSGVEEANPFVRGAIRMMGDPLLGLLAVKAVAMGLGVFCFWRGRLGLMRRINIFFAVLVAWNLISLIAGLVVRIH